MNEQNACEREAPLNRTLLTYEQFCDALRDADVPAELHRLKADRAFPIEHLWALYGVWYLLCSFQTRRDDSGDSKRVADAEEIESLQALARRASRRYRRYGLDTTRLDAAFDALNAQLSTRRGTRRRGAPPKDAVGRAIFFELWKTEAERRAGERKRLDSVGARLLAVFTRDQRTMLHPSYTRRRYREAQSAAHGNAEYLVSTLRLHPVDLEWVRRWLSREANEPKCQKSTAESRLKF